MKKNWRPKDWPKCPCDDCPDKEIDSYSYYCAIVCRKRTDWVHKEDGADAMLEALKKDAFRLDMENLGCGFCKDTAGELEPIGWWAYEKTADSKMGQGYLVFIPEEEDEDKTA